MADKPLKTSDIIDVGQDIEKLIAEFNKLEKSVVSSLTNISKAGDNLKQQLTGVEKEIRNNVEATSKLESNTQKNENALKSNTDQLGKLSKKYTDTNEAVKNSDVVLSKLGKSLGDQKKRVKILKEEYEKLDPTIDGNKKRLSQLSSAISRTRADIKKLNDASNRLNRTFEESSTSYNGLINQNRRIRAILNKLPQEFIKTNKRAQQLQKTFRDNTEQLKKFDKALGQNFRNVGNYGDSLGQLNGLAAKAKEFLGPVGLAGAAALVAREFFNATKQLEKNQKIVGKLFKGGKADIKAYTAQATALSQVFEKDFNEVVKAANAITEQFGGNASDSFDLVEEALIRGADINDDFLDQISEYSTQFSEAGVEAGTLVDILIAAEDKGVFSDKAADAVKEATISLRELTPATRDAITGLGLSVDQIQKDLRSGARTSFQVIQDISAQLDKFPEQSAEVGTAIADIFRGAGEDAGLAFLKTLKDINTETDDYRDTLNESQLATVDYLDSQKELNSELLNLEANTATLTKQFKTFFNNIATFGLQIIGDLTREFTSLDTRITDFRKTIGNVQDINVAKDTLEDLNEELENSRKSFGQLIEEGNIGEFIRKSLQVSRGASGIAEAGRRQAELIIKIEETEKRIAELQEEINERRRKDAQRQADKRVKISEDEARRRREALREKQKLMLEDEIELLEETEQNEKASINERLAASELIVDKQIELAKLEKEGKLDVARELLSEELALIDEQNNIAVSKAERAGQARADALFSAAEKAVQKEDFKALIDKDLKDRLNAIEVAKNAELLAIEEREMNTRDKEQAIFNIEEEFRRKSLEATIAFLRNKKEVFAETESERLEITKQISELELQLAQDTGEKKVNITGEVKSQLFELEQTIADAVTARFDTEISQLDDRQQALQERLDFEIEQVGENEDAKIKLKEEFKKEEEKIERERARLERRKANFEKLRAIFKIGIDTAQGISAQLPGLPFSAPLIALITALGAAQIAAVSAQQVPSFSKGTYSAPKGPILVGEEGQELVYDKKTGDAYLTPGEPTLTTDVPEGAMIMDAVTTKSMLNKNSIDDIKDRNFTKSMGVEQKRLEKAHYQYTTNTNITNIGDNIDYNRLGKVIGKNIPPSNIIEFEKNGTVKTYIQRRDGTRVEDVNKRSTLIHPDHPLNKTNNQLNHRLYELERQAKRIS